MILGVIAVAQELRAPTEPRTWHGKVADLVPYDFRRPTGERFGRPTGILTGRSSRARSGVSDGLPTSAL